MAGAVGREIHVGAEGKYTAPGNRRSPRFPLELRVGRGWAYHLEQRPERGKSLALEGGAASPRSRIRAPSLAPYFGVSMKQDRLRTNLRRATPSDAEDLSQLALRSKAHWGYDSVFLGQCRDELTYTPEQLDSELIFLLEDRDRVFGFYGSSGPVNDSVELDAMFVDPPYIGRGLGRQLFEHAKVIAAGLNVGSLIIQSDPQAAEFYRRCGALDWGRRESESVPGRFLPVLRIQLV